MDNLHERLHVSLTRGQTLSLARLVRAARNRASRKLAKSTYVPPEGMRDNNQNAVDGYEKLLTVLLDAAGISELDEGRPSRRPVTD